ncbi:MAG: hypothetical protein ACLR60_18010 [Clostridium paraputrificum]
MDELDNLILKVLNEIFVKLELNIEENENDIWREIEHRLNEIIV